MKYIYINIGLILLIIVLVYAINKKTDNYSNYDSNVLDIDRQIKQVLLEEHPSTETTLNDLQQLLNLEEQCNVYFKKQQETVNKDVLILQNKQKNILKQQKKQINEYKKLLLYLKEVYDKDTISVTSCVTNNNNNINMDGDALNNMNGLISNNKLEILLKK